MSNKKVEGPHSGSICSPKLLVIEKRLRASMITHIPYHSHIMEFLILLVILIPNLDHQHLLIGNGVAVD